MADGLAEGNKSDLYTAQKFLDLLFAKEFCTKCCPRETLFRKSTFTGTLCSFFETWQSCKDRGDCDPKTQGILNVSKFPKIHQVTPKGSSMNWGIQEVFESNHSYAVVSHLLWQTQKPLPKQHCSPPLQTHPPQRQGRTR